MPDRQDIEGRFRRLLAANRRRLMGIARSYAPPDDAADLFQEMLLQIWKGLPGFEGRSSESTWVYRVALNTAMTHRRDRGVRQRHVTVDGRAAELAAPATLPGERGDDLVILRRFLAGLGPVERGIFLMYLDDLSYREMADVTGLSVSNVGVKIHRVKQALAEKLAR